MGVQQGLAVLVAEQAVEGGQADAVVQQAVDEGHHLLGEGLAPGRGPHITVGSTSGLTPPPKLPPDDQSVRMGVGGSFPGIGRFTDKVSRSGPQG